MQSQAPRLGCECRQHSGETLTGDSMSLALSIAVPNPRLSTFDGLKVEFNLRNDGHDPLQIPNPNYDTSGAFGIQVRGHSDMLLRHMDGITSQMMLSVGRADDRPTLGTL